MMRQDIELENQLSRDELIALKNKRTGLAIFQLSWILVFVCLSIVNLQIRGNFPSWPPSGVERLNAVLPAVATVLLLISAVLARRASQAVQTGAFFGQWRGAIVLGAAFVAIMAYEWLMVEISGQYSTIFRVMTAFHAFHALVIGVIMVQVYRAAKAGVYGWMVEAAAKLWYFVVVAWGLFYVVLYWI